MQKWFKKMGLSILMGFCLFAILAGGAHAIMWAKAENSIQSVTIKIGTEKINKRTYSMKQGSSKKVRLLAMPEKSKVKAKYYSSKKNIVSVSKTGVLKAEKAGTAKITATVSGKENFQKKIWFKIKVINQNHSGKKKEIPVTLTVGGKTFTAKFYDNKTTEALLEEMPMTLSMKELNGNEKYHYFDVEFPAKETSPKQIQAGEIKLYGEDCLVVFYKTHTTSYQYTSVGYVEDVPGFVKAVGDGNVTVTFQSLSG
ncbi:MAG: hypothetical protein HFH68_00915 [Lachnospiraceae bacterium]|nr:hypothetical protein [Lachnospiraceae bacterium]